MPNTLTKEIKYTAIWGSNFPRLTGFGGKWLAIPMGYMIANVSFGVSSTPATSYTLTVQADDLNNIIWQPLSSIIVRKCRIYYGQGQSSNTTHMIALMRYDIDADGDLTNGIEMGATASIIYSDDYSHVRSTDLTINGDNTVTTNQVLIGMIMCNTNVNFAVTVKCIIEYTM